MLERNPAANPGGVSLFAACQGELCGADYFFVRAIVVTPDFKNIARERDGARCLKRVQYAGVGAAKDYGRPAMGV